MSVSGEGGGGGGEENQDKDEDKEVLEKFSDLIHRFLVTGSFFRKEVRG